MERGQWVLASFTVQLNRPLEAGNLYRLYSISNVGNTLISFFFFFGNNIFDNKFEAKSIKLKLCIGRVL